MEARAPLRTNYVLIDFENLQPELLDALDLEHFRVLVFIGANQTKVTVEFAALLQRLGTRAQYLRISGAGRNALDFHIAFYIGELLAKNPTAVFHVIAVDGGYDPLLQHLKDRNVLARRHSRSPTSLTSRRPVQKRWRRRPPSCVTHSPSAAPADRRH